MNSTWVRWLVAIALFFGLPVREALSQTIVKPEFLLIVDTSGSMYSTTTTANSCGYPQRRINEAACAVRNLADSAGDAIFGLGMFSLTCSTTGPSHYTSPFANGCGSGCTAVPNADPTALAFPSYPYPFYGCPNSATIDVPIGESTMYTMRSWGDGSWDSCTTAPTSPLFGGNELSTGPAGEYGRGGAPSNVNTPLAGALREALDYLRNANAPTMVSPYVNFNNTGAPDPYASCRPMNVILLTDGGETCSSNPPRGARLNARNISCLQVDLNGNGTIENPIPMSDPNPALRGKYEANIDLNSDGDCYDTVAGAVEQRAFKTRTYVIGFGITCPDTDIENMALAGGVPTHTVSSCTGSTNRRGYYASSEAEIAAAINAIIAESALREKCNGADDDCDGLTDEDFVLGAACTSGTGACARTGTTICNTAQNDVTCNAVPGAPSTELCSNGADDDCDNRADCADTDCATNTICTGACSPLPEVCDGRDNDCDGLVDEGSITRPCGSAIGICTTGTQTCTQQTAPGSGSAQWSACTGTPATTETCNNLDDNCNGATDDGLTQSCVNAAYPAGTVCHDGTRTCTGGTFGSCVTPTPGTEICNGADDDCDLMSDEGLGSTTCGIGACLRTVQNCVGGCRSDLHARHGRHGNLQRRRRRLRRHH